MSAGDDGSWPLARQKDGAWGREDARPKKTIHGHHELSGLPAPSPACKNGSAEKTCVMFVTLQMLACQFEVHPTNCNSVFPAFRLQYTLLLIDVMGLNLKQLIMLRLGLQCLECLGLPEALQVCVLKELLPLHTTDGQQLLQQVSSLLRTPLERQHAGQIVADAAALLKAAKLVRPLQGLPKTVCALLPVCLCISTLP